jgi:hypothetical protein
MLSCEGIADTVIIVVLLRFCLVGRTKTFLIFTVENPDIDPTGVELESIMHQFSILVCSFPSLWTLERDGFAILLCVSIPLNSMRMELAW